MDKPGSRPDTTGRPLIIERPDLAHPARRVLAPCLTVLAWCTWLAMWLPLWWTSAEKYLPRTALSGARSLEALRHLLDVFPLAIMLLIAFLAANGMVTWVYRKLSGPKERRSVDTRRLAAGTGLTESDLGAWQMARVLLVTHSTQGRVTDARIVR